MKKINLLAVMVLLLVSCQIDDETMVPLQDAEQTITEQILAATSVTLQWEDLHATFYEVEYGPLGFVRGEGRVATTSVPSITLTELIPDTTYEYYVRAFFPNSSINIIRSVRNFTTMMAPVVTTFKPNLSEMRLFRGTLSNLTPSPYAFVYDLNSRLFTDYAHKQRVIAIPLGTSLVSNGDGLPDFPENSVIAKTFYYNIDDRDLSLGRNLVETRVMIKKNGIWEFGNYIWNEEQTDAVLNNDGSINPLSWIDIDGITHNTDYVIPSGPDCFVCHQSYGIGIPIGPKLRSMNFDIEGVNQLQRMITNGELTNVPDVTAIGTLPNWEDATLTDEIRVRAYFDMNCAHCHSAGGYHTVNFFDALNTTFEVPFEETNIYYERYSILARMQSSIEEYSMPYLGVTSPHQEALDLIVPYLESLE